MKTVAFWFGVFMFLTFNPLGMIFGVGLVIYGKAW